MQPNKFEKTWQRHTFQMHWSDLSILQMKVIYLNAKLRRLEFKWRNPVNEDLPRLRKRRAEIRHEFEMLKVDLEVFERRVKPFFKALPEPEAK